MYVYQSSNTYLLFKDILKKKKTIYIYIKYIDINTHVCTFRACAQLQDANERNKTNNTSLLNKHVNQK